MDRAGCSSGPEIGVACVKLSDELKSALGLTASKFSKFVKLEALTEELKKLSIHLPALETCKCEIVLVKADEVKDQLQIFLNESTVEKEIWKGLQEFAIKKTAQEEIREKDESAASSPVHRNKNLMGAAEQGWICLGSDAEIIQSHAPKQRPLLAVEAEISRRKKSYKVGELKKYDAKVASFHASKEKVQVVERKFMDACTQAGESIDAEAQTLINFPKHVWTQWSPQNRDFDAEYSEEQKKHLKEWVQEKANLVLDCAHHNCILENHVDDFQLLMMSDDLKREFMTEAEKEYVLSNIVSSFCFCQGVAIAYAWHPSYKNFLAISYGNEQKFAPADEESSVCDDLSEIAEKQSSLFVEKVVIWDCDAKKPRFSLTSSSIVECLLFCPKDERLLFGGCHNGDIRIWKFNFQPNREQNSDKITVVDPLLQKKSSSRKSIIGIHWLEESNQFVAVSVDGCIVIWILEEDISIRETGVKYSVRGKNMFIASISRLAKIAQKSLKDGEIENVFKLLLGSQEGTISVFEIDTKPKEIEEDDDEEVQANTVISLDPSKSPNIHDGPVADIRAAPLEENIYLSVGGHVFAIFSLGRESCPIFLKIGNQILSSCAWSCFSKNLFYICTTTGKLQVWNLLNAKSNLEAQFCISPGYIRDLSSPESQMRNGILHLTDDRGSIMFCQIAKIHQVENKSAAKVFLRELERINLPGSIALPAPEKSLLLAEEVKKRQEVLRREEETLNLKMASLIKPERREVLVLREKQVSKDKATRLEATRQLQLLDELPKQLLGLKGIDMKRLTEFEEPMLDLQRRDKRRSILREARVRVDSDF